MRHIVTASVHFSFKGQRHTPSLTLEPDKHLESTGTLPNLYPLIARENNFDLYSYEYEMMQAEPIIFSDAQGLIAEFIVAGELDLTAFQNAWQENQTIEKLQKIARRHMQVNDFSQHPELKSALIEAYNAGTKKLK